MAQVTKETIITKVISPEEKGATILQTLEYLIYFVLALLEILLTFRFILKLLGADASGEFVRLIYDISSVFVTPFEGIFRSGTTQGIETTAVFESSTIVAIFVFAILAWGSVELIKLLSGKKQAE